MILADEVVPSQKSLPFQLVDATIALATCNASRTFMPTKSVSLEASLSTGIMKRKKNKDRMAKPFAVRAYGSKIRILLWQLDRALGLTTTP